MVALGVPGIHVRFISSKHETAEAPRCGRRLCWWLESPTRAAGSNLFGIGGSNLGKDGAFPHQNQPLKKWFKRVYLFFFSWEFRGDIWGWGCMEKFGELFNVLLPTNYSQANIYMYSHIRMCIYNVYIYIHIYSHWSSFLLGHNGPMFFFSKLWVHEIFLIWEPFLKHEGVAATYLVFLAFAARLWGDLLKMGPCLRKKTNQKWTKNLPDQRDRTPTQETQRLFKLFERVSLHLPIGFLGRMDF